MAFILDDSSLSSDQDAN